MHVHIDRKKAKETKDAATNGLIAKRYAIRNEQGDQAEHSKDGSSSVCGAQYENVPGYVRIDAAQMQAT